MKSLVNLVLALALVLSGLMISWSAPTRDKVATNQKNIMTMLPFPAHSTIEFQGDSITDGGRWNSTDPNHVFGQCYVYLIAAACTADHPEMQWNFINRGVSGNTVTDLTKRWSQDTLTNNPDVLSILIGINDTMKAVHLGGPDSIGAAQFEQTYDNLIQQAVAENPRVKLVLGMPFIEHGNATDANFDSASAIIKTRQSIVMSLGAKYHATVINYQALFDNAISQSKQPSTYWVWDGVHPTSAGHELMAREWIRAVNNQGR